MSKKQKFIVSSSSDDSDCSETYSSDTSESESESESESTNRKITKEKYEAVAKNVKPKNDSDILNICYEVIDANFSYGCCSNIDVVVENKTGYINATHLCKRVGKKFRNWAIESDTYEELLKVASKHTSITKKNLIKKYVTKNPETTGSYIHSCLMFSVGTWASTELYLRMVGVINGHFISQAHNESIQEKEQQIQKIKRLIQEKERQIQEKEELINEKKQVIRDKKKLISNLSKQVKENKSKIKANNSRTNKKSK